MKKALKILLLLLIFTTALSLFFAIYIFKIKKQAQYCAHEHITVSTVLPTCESEGKTMHTCNDCSYHFITDPVPKAAHKYVSRTVPPTCTSEGYTFYFCACGDFYKGESIPAIEHTFAEQAFTATCTSEGYIEHTCQSCGYSYKDTTTPTAPHEYVSTVYLPTALKSGYTEHICSCSESYKDTFISYTEILSSPYVDSSDILSRGIDVSRWNHQIDAASGEYLPLDWQLIKSSGFDFVIIKAGSTRSGKEPTFEMDYEGAKSAGIAVGAYFYTYSSTEEGIKNDVESLLGYLSGKTFEYPIYFDLEDPSLISLGKSELTRLCEVFICSMQENGYYSALYTNNNWLRNILDTSRILSLFDIWYARYPQTELPVWNEEKYGKQLSMWQYTQTGEIDGIEGYFDMNLCYRNYTDIMKKWKLNGFSGY